MSRFKDKKVVVTGGTRGIGRAIVERLLSEGAFVCFSSRKKDAVEAAVAELASVYGAERVFGVVAHLGRDSRTDVVDRAVELWGGELHGLVLNAAVSPPIMNVLDADERGFAKVLGTNVTANAMLVQAAAPHLAATAKKAKASAADDEEDGGGAAVVLISSISAYNPTFPHPVYGQCKMRPSVCVRGVIRCGVHSLPLLNLSLRGVVDRRVCMHMRRGVEASRARRSFARPYSFLDDSALLRAARDWQARRLYPPRTQRIRCLFVCVCVVERLDFITLPPPLFVGISKTALHGLAKALAAELGGDGVRVNVRACVCADL